MREGFFDSIKGMFDFLKDVAFPAGKIEFLLAAQAVRN
jgi:hypothetical protein